MYVGVNGSVSFDYDIVSLVIQTLHIRPAPGDAINVQVTNTNNGHTISRIFTTAQDIAVAAANVVFDKFSPNPTYTAQVW